MNQKGLKYPEYGIFTTIKYCVPGNIRGRKEKKKDYFLLIFLPLVCNWFVMDWLSG